MDKKLQQLEARYKTGDRNARVPYLLALDRAGQLQESELLRKTLVTHTLEEAALDIKNVLLSYVPQLTPFPTIPCIQPDDLYQWDVDAPAELREGFQPREEQGILLYPNVWGGSQQIITPTGLMRCYIHIERNFKFPVATSFCETSSNYLLHGYNALERMIEIRKERLL